MSTLQTLDRGLTALEVISQADRGLTMQELADELGVHRAIAYRLVATLVEHRLVTRFEDGRIRIGSAVLELAGRYAPQFREANRDLLPALANEVGATAFIAVADGDEAVVVAVAEPSKSSIVRVGYRPGLRHPLTQGATGLAILASRPASPDDSPRIAEVRERGWAHTSGEIEAGASGVAAGFRSASLNGMWQDACVCVVALESLNLDLAIPAVLRTADQLRRT